MFIKYMGKRQYEHVKFFFFFLNWKHFYFYPLLAGIILLQGNAMAAGSSYLPLYGITFVAADFKEISGC